MQRLIKIVFLFVALIYLGGMIYQVGYFAYFKVNQDAIIAEYCINKDKPEMECNGHCHLKKELQKVQVIDGDEQNESEEGMPVLEMTFLIAVFPVDHVNDSSSTMELYELKWDRSEDLCSTELENIWHPPKV